MSALLRTAVGLGSAFLLGAPAVDVVRGSDEADPYYPPFEITLAEIDLIVPYVNTLGSPE